MRIEVIEKLKEKEVSEKVLEAKSGEEVYEIFKSKGMEISKGKENLVSEISKLSDEDLTLSGGMGQNSETSDDQPQNSVVDGLIRKLDNALFDYSIEKFEAAPSDSTSKAFWDVVSDYSSPIVEGTVGLALVGTTVAATLGIPKIYNYCKNKLKKKK